MSLRDGPFQDIKVPLTWTAAVAVVVTAVIGVALVLGDRRETVQGHASEVARDAFDRVARPVSGILDAPVRWVDGGVAGVRSYFFAVSENRRLKQEVADLTHWRNDAIALRHDNERYEALLGLRTDPPIPMVAARVIADDHGPFAQTRLADAGVEAGVRSGNPVMTEHGLVGRILGVAKGVSRILLLTDVSSRLPIMDDRTDSRGILTGDGSGAPTLEYLRGDQPVKAGDRILSSGDGGLFPRGLPVGEVYQSIDGNWRVRLDADDGPIDNVRILLFRDVSQLARQPGLSSTSIPPLAPADAAQVAAEANAASQSSAPPASTSHPTHAAATAAPTVAATQTAPHLTVTTTATHGASAPVHAPVAASAHPAAHLKHRPATAASSGAPPAPDDTMPPT
ncbi:MAG TPA: rod shape-determining protein MreC [Caulobacteraceae bacterium]|nr:rod shape-determining protein MreC [Caulobacteraceae bacterium]